MIQYDDYIFRKVGVDEPDILQQIFNLRVICRQGSQDISFDKFPNGWSDEIDYFSEHFTVFYKNKLIASGRITLLQNIKQHPYFPAIESILSSSILKVPIAYLSRDQVLEEHRGQGIRGILLKERETFCI